jgi:hypothetical protein
MALFGGLLAIGVFGGPFFRGTLRELLAPSKRRLS